MTEKTLRFPR